MLPGQSAYSILAPNLKFFATPGVAALGSFGCFFISNLCWFIVKRAI
jgi:hypothetical protein